MTSLKAGIVSSFSNTFDVRRPMKRATAREPESLIVALSEIVGSNSNV